jgi:hypothetical protein
LLLIKLLLNRPCPRHNQPMAQHADQTKAISYIEANGDLLEQARLRYLLEQKPPAAEAVRQLYAAQQPDGGWSPFWSPDYSSVDATCFRLSQAWELGLGIAELAVADGLRFLMLRQREDGSWEEEAEVADVAPPWAMPGDAAARLYLTANAGYWLALYEMDGALAAAHFLSAQQELHGRLPSFLHAHWLAAALWQHTAQTAEAERTLAYLLTRLAAERLSPANLAWLINALYDAGIPATDPLIAEAAEHLAALQEDDGSWAADDGPLYTVQTTLQALRALRLTSS